MLTTIEQESSSVRLLHCIFEKDLRGPSINSAGTVVHSSAEIGHDWDSHPQQVPRKGKMEGT